MGKTKENPRYNILSLRCSNEELAVILQGVAMANIAKSNYLLRAALDTARRQEEEQVRERVKREMGR